MYPDLSHDGDAVTREAGSCAPFVWDEQHVQPIWQRLADRAALLGQPVPRPGVTTDPDLRIQVGGKEVRPLFSKGDLHVFVLPNGSPHIRVLSRASAPTDARPWMEDRRVLGVYVKRIVLKTSQDVQEIPLDHPALAEGWWSVERQGYELSRWTTGDALVALPATDSPSTLEIHAGTSGMTYLADQPAGQVPACEVPACEVPACEIVALVA